MPRRLLLFLAALVVALAGTVAVFVAATGRPSAAAVDEPVRQVLVATQVIPAGTPGRQAQEQGLVAPTDMPVRLIPAGALDTVELVATRVTVADVQPGEVLLEQEFVGAERAGALDIPDDKIAISATFEDPQRVAGFVLPGSEVAVFATYDVAAPPAEPTSDDTAPPLVNSATRLLLPRATVIASGPIALRTVGGRGAAAGDEAAEGTTSTSALVTLALPVEEAQVLAHAAQTSRLYLGLLSEESRTDSSGPVDNRSIFN